MAWSISDLFPPWGDAGERPSDNFQYDGGDQVNEKHFDYLWDNVASLENEVRSALTDIDQDQDGVVDKANAGADPFDLDGDLVAAGGEIIWDESAGAVPDSALADPRTDVSDGGTGIVNDVTDINFGTDLGVTDDGDGSVTVNNTAGDTRTDVSEDGTTVVADTTDINFTNGVSVADDGDGTVTVDADEAAAAYSYVIR